MTGYGDSPLVDYFCPAHGWILATFRGSLVECQCGASCAPEGETPKEHTHRYFAIVKKRYQRRAKRDNREQ